MSVGDGDSVLISNDGISWKQQRAPISGMLLSSIAYGSGTFVAVGDVGTVLTSTNSMDWCKRTLGTCAYLKQVTFENGTFVAVNAHGQKARSVDGVTWETAGGVCLK